MSGTLRSLLVGSSLVGFVVACGSPAPAPATPPASTASPTPAASAQEPVRAAPTAAKDGAIQAPAPPGVEWPAGPAPNPEERAAQLDRLKKDQGPLKTNWVPPGKSERYGHAEGLIAASPDVVRARLVDFAHYKDLAGPKFKTVNVVEKSAKSTDLYFQLPIMKGLVTIWYVTRFGAARPLAGGGDLIEGTFVKGNIRGMHIAFGVRPGPDDKSTVLVCDLLLSPNIPAPQAALDEELRDACGDAVNAVRAKTTAPSP